MSDGIASIGNDAFSDCSNLTSIIFPYSLSSIGDDAFSNCYYLLEIAIPENCALSSNAFKDCFGLEVVNALKSSFGPLNVKDNTIQQHIKNILYFLSYLEGYYEGKYVYFGDLFTYMRQYYNDMKLKDFVRSLRKFITMINPLHAELEIPALILSLLHCVKKLMNLI